MLLTLVPNAFAVVFNSCTPIFTSSSVGFSDSITSVPHAVLFLAELKWSSIHTSSLLTTDFIFCITTASLSLLSSSST